MLIVSRTEKADVAHLRHIELSAARAFLKLPEFAWIASSPVMPEAEHFKLISGGASWVVSQAEGPVMGFIAAKLLDSKLHILELSVRYELQGQGAGKALLTAAFRWASEQEIPALTLTTFRHVPWNKPFYELSGFRMFADEELTPALRRILAAEVNAGFRARDRCAMIRLSA